MSGYVIRWEFNEDTGRWFHGHNFWAENDFEAIKYAMEWLDGEKVFSLDRTGFDGWPIRNVVTCTDKVC